MRYCPQLTRSSLVLIAVFVSLAHSRADELLPPPIPVLRIGGDNTEYETVPAPRAEPSPEVITERYPNRKVKIERHVVQDDDRNYVSHGPWKMYDPEGRLVAHGEFRFGKQHGTWVRLMSAFGVVDDAFQAPFTSQAEFANGKLNGIWSVADRRQRLVGNWEFQRGELHGKVSTWYANGQPREEMTFKRGKLDDVAISWTAQGAVANREYFRDGKQLIPVVTWHEPNRQKQAEGWTQTSELAVVTTIDWWQGLLEISREPPRGEPVRIGPWKEWHANGSSRFVGSFRDGQPIGNHTWWHENGQKQLAGRFAEGERVDRWTRWHDNGRKQEEGAFALGVKQGLWQLWADNGQLIDEQDNVSAPNIADHDLVPAYPVSIDP